MKLFLNYLQNDWLRKLISLVLTFGLWFIAKKQLESVKDIESVPVAFSVEEPLTVIENSKRYNVTLTISGDQEKLNKVNLQKIHINVRIPKMNNPGSQINQEISTADVDLPHGLKVVKITPSHILVDVDRLVTKDVPVNVVTSGKLPSKLQELEENRKVSPQRIEIRGPETIVKGIDRLLTETVYFNDEMIGPELERILSVVNKNKQVKLAHDSVTVTFDIAETASERFFRELPIKVASFQNHHLAIKGKLPLVSQVTAIGPKTKLSELKNSDVTAFIDITNVKNKGVHVVPIKIWLPTPEIDVLFTSPSKIEVEIIDNIKQDSKGTESGAPDPKLLELEKESGLLK